MTAKKASDAARKQFGEDCRDGLRRAQALRPVVVARGAGVLDRYNELLVAASRSNAMAGLMSEVHPDEAIRDAAREVEQEVSRFYSDLALDRDVYDALAAVDVATADVDTKRFVAHALRDYRRAGVDRPAEVRARLKEIDEALTRLGQQFSKTIAEDVRSVEVADPARLAGLPADFVAAHPPDAHGVVRFTTDYPDYNPVMTYATDDALRRELYVAFRSRGDRPAPVFDDLAGLASERMAACTGRRGWLVLRAVAVARQARRAVTSRRRLVRRVAR